MDTRTTSPALVAAAMKGCDIMGVRTCNFGKVTTPQLHWLVSHRYTHFNDAGLYTQYYKDKFLSFVGLCQNHKLGKSEEEKSNYQPDLVLDCANGVGSLVIGEINGLTGFSERLKLTLINDEKSPENLNADCGAEHINKE
mmetsp:Transcript_1838/g.2482  ORF Transcript_1838/g.2482 Transcript_1838/m.2482 type:complete len:140 (+) Transcript_1838:442-861(+)